LTAVPIDDAHEAQPNLQARAASSVVWRLTTSIGQALLQFGSGVVLARILLPEEFGVVALATIVVSFATLVTDIGLGPAIVQRPDLTERHIRTAYTVSCLAGMGVAGIVLGLAHAASVLLGNVAVEPVLRILSLIFVFSGLGSVSSALLKRRLEFRKLAYVELGSYLVAYFGIGVPLALQEYGYWSLVYAALGRTLLWATLALLFARASLRPLIGLAELRQMAGFGLGMLATDGVNWFALHGDYFMVGRILGAGSLALYTRAYQLMTLPLNYVVSSLSQVVFPAASAIQNDMGRLHRAYLKTLTLAGLTVSPIVAFLVVLAREVIVGLYGPNWQGVVYPFRVLAVFGMARAIYNVSASFVRAKGRVRPLLTSQVVYATAILIGAWLGATYWDLVGVALAVGISVVLMCILVVLTANAATGARLGEFLASQLPGLVLVLPVAGTALASKFILVHIGFRPFIIVILSGILCLLSGCVTIYLFRSSLFCPAMRILNDIINSVIPSCPHRFVMFGAGRHLKTETKE
jgi:O-antigen/teichoic acid export membrane protein